MLDLGDNKIKFLDGVEEIPHLEELHLTSNKLKEIGPLIKSLKKLRVIGFQCNELTKIENLEESETLEEAYFQQNFLEKIEGFEGCPHLQILDIAVNRIEAIENLDTNTELTDLWLNSNRIKSWDSIKYLANLQNLDTIYLHTNPVSLVRFVESESGEEAKETQLEKSEVLAGVKIASYLDWMMEHLPNIQQIDSEAVVMLRKRKELMANPPVPTQRQQQLTKAQAILKDLIKEGKN